MPLNESNVRQARFYPEILPDTQVLTVGAGNIENILDLRRIEPKWVQFRDFASQNSLNNFLRIVNDRKSYDIDTIDLKDLQPNAFNVVGTEFLTARLNAVAGVANFLLNYTLAVFEPSVAHKILYNKVLTSEEEDIADRLNLKREVQNGLLPLQIDYKLQREYELVDARRTFTYGDGAFTAAGETIDRIPALKDEIVVLEGISAGTISPIADNLRIIVDRDGISDYLELPVYAFNYADDIDVKCFVPALRELRLRAVSNVAGTANVRYTIAKYRLTDLLKIRFGLVTKDEVPDDLWFKVKGGVL